MFSLASIKASVEAAVAAAAAEPEAERRKRIRQLQLRWHPGEFSGRGLWVWPRAQLGTPPQVLIATHSVACVCVCVCVATPTLVLLMVTDKNPVLKEFATEVTKIINEAVGKLEGGRG